MSTQPRLAAALVGTCFALLCVWGITQEVGCKTPAAKTAEEGAVRIGVEFCKEEVGASGVALSPDEIALLCETAGAVVRVILPRAEWHAIAARSARRVDAGPGK